MFDDSTPRYLCPVPTFRRSMQEVACPLSSDIESKGVEMDECAELKTSMQSLCLVTDLQ